ncbi:MAG: hypothetical protein R3C51_13650 [Parvularculaceae bacterium]
MNMNKIMLMLNIQSMNALPVMERWLLRTHAPETVSRVGPWLTRYQSYRAVPPPPKMHRDAEAYGYYNWRITELWTAESALPQSGILPQEFFPEYAGILGLPTDVADAEIWRNDSRQSARCMVPARPTNDFKGDQIPVFDYPSILRWVTMSKLPPGVSADAADDWFVNTHAPELLEHRDLKRLVSWRVISTGRSWDWYRVTEHWFEDFDGWRRATIENPPKFTKPDWAAHDAYPFFAPYADFCSTFVLETPTNCFLPPYGDYVPSV